MPVLAARFNYCAEDTFDIATNVYYGNASGLDLANLNYTNKYVKIARKINTKFSDFISSDKLNCLYPSNSSAAANQYPVNNQSDPAGFDGVVNYIEPAYLSISTAVNTVLTRARQFPLGALTNTVFALDKDLYIPTDMYIRITAGPGNTFCFVSASDANPSTSAAGVTGNITISNVYLYLAVETNQLIIDSLMTKVSQQGLKLNIPYTIGFRNSSTGTVANISVPLTSQYGKYLKQILTLVFNGVESANTALDCGNFNGTKIVSYNTYINNKPLQDNKINVIKDDALGIPANIDDYRENQRFIKGSVYYNREMYAQNWFHLDKFYEDDDNSNIPEENRQDGINMATGPILWQLQATTVDAPWSHYQFATFNRDVVIDQLGFRFE